MAVRHSSAAGFDAIAVRHRRRHPPAEPLPQQLTRARGARPTAATHERSHSMSSILDRNVARRVFVSTAVGAALVRRSRGLRRRARRHRRRPSVRPRCGLLALPPPSRARTPPPSRRHRPRRRPPSLPAVTASHADPALEALLPAEISGTRDAALQRHARCHDRGRCQPHGDRRLPRRVSASPSRTGRMPPPSIRPTRSAAGSSRSRSRAWTPACCCRRSCAVEQSDLGTGATTSQATVGGKHVTVVSVGNGVNDTEWVYARDGVVFVIHAADEAHAAGFLEAL